MASSVVGGIADEVWPGVKVMAGGVVELLTMAFCGPVVTVESGVRLIYSKPPRTAPMVVVFSPEVMAKMSEEQ